MEPSSSSAPQQQLIILAGVVGSGKSTFSKALVKQLPNWSRVNQDDLGDRRACEALVRSGLAAGKNVVVDRQNFDAAQRRTWLEIGAEFPHVVVDCLVMGTSEQECSERLRIRTNHPTIDNPVLAAELLDRFLGLWSEPSLDEGYDHLLTLPSLPDSPFLTAELLGSLLLALAQSPANPQAQVQRRPKPRQSNSSYGAPHRGAISGAPRGGFGGPAPRGGYAGPSHAGPPSGQIWGRPPPPSPQQHSAWGAIAPGQQLGGRGSEAGEQRQSSWTAGPPHVWGAGRTLGGDTPSAPQ